MAIKIRILKEATAFGTAVMPGKVASPVQGLPRLPASLVAEKYNLEIVKDLSVGKTAFSDVYLTEPKTIADFGFQKQVVLKLSKNSNEHIAYDKIKEIKQQMIVSKDETDNAAAKFLPNVYVAEPIIIDRKGFNADSYNSIIVMEVLKDTHAGVSDITSNPISKPSLLLKLLKEENFVYKLVKTAFNSVADEKFRIDDEVKQKIMNDIFTGKDLEIPSGSKNDSFFNHFKLPQGIYRFATDPKDKEAFIIAETELNRIAGIIFMNWPPNRSWMKIKFAERFMHTLGTSIPVAPKSGKNPYDQNKETSPEEDYGGIAISFNNALQRLEDYGMSRRDLHGNNYMMRSDGHLVISDPGMFTSTTTGITESFLRKIIKKEIVRLFS